MPSLQSLLLFNSLYLNSVCNNSKQKLFSSAKVIETTKTKLKTKSDENDDEDAATDKEVSTSKEKSLFIVTAI